MVLDKLGKSLNATLKRLFRSNIVDKETINELVKDIQRALLVADVDVELVMDITKSIRDGAMDEKLPRGMSRKEHIIKLLWDILSEYLGGKVKPIRFDPGKTNILMFVGVQGSGKTTTIGKLALYYQKRGIKSGVVCADNFRPGAYDQLEQLAKRAHVPFWGDRTEKSAIKLARSGMEYMKSKKIEMILLDTSGRHSKEKELLIEMRKVAEKISPREIILVLDGTLGQQAKIQAMAFKNSTNIGSIIVTKLDGNAKGGGALSAVASVGVPIKFIGTGEGLSAIEGFDPHKFVGSMLGIADIKGLIKKIEKIQVELDDDFQKRAMKGKITLADMVNQIKQLKRLGPLSKVMGMLGIKYDVPDDFASVQEDKLKKFEVILGSMTKYELENPKVLKSSRIKRVAMGSGTSEAVVKELLNNYNTMRTTMKKLLRSRKKMRL